MSAEKMPGSEIARLVRTFYARKHRRPLVSHGKLSRLGALADDPALANVRSVIDAAPEVHAIPTVAAGLEASANYGSGVLLSKSSALPLFNAGNTLIIKSIGDVVPSLASVWHDLSQTFGIFARPTIFMSPPNVGTPMHFDALESLVIQVRGSKRWWTSPNRDLDGSAPWDSHLLYDQRPKRAITLKPGSVLIMPAGTWHSTEGIDDSISVSAFLSLPTWLNVLRRALDEIAPATWNQPAIERVLSGTTGHEVRQRLTELFQEAASRSNGTSKTASRAERDAASRAAGRRALECLPAYLARVSKTPARLQRKRGYFITGNLLVGSPPRSIPIPADLWEVTRSMLASDPVDVAALYRRLPEISSVSDEAFAGLIETLLKARVFKASRPLAG